MEITFSGGVLPEELQGDEWVLGAQMPEIEILSSGDWKPYLPTNEKQATRVFDPYSCVSESLTNVLETHLNYLMTVSPTIKPILEKLQAIDENGKADFSARWLAKMSGTIPGVGNSLQKVAETVRKFGLVGEKRYPKTEDMSEAEYYKDMTQEEKDMGLEFLKYFDYNHSNLPRKDALSSSNEQLKLATKCGTPQVCVDGRYSYDENGMVGKIISYNHATVYVNQSTQESAVVNHDVFDTYDPFLKKFIPEYQFGTPKVHVIKKKTPMYKLYKKNGQSAIAVKHWAEDSLIAFASGTLPGGDLFKSLYNIKDYSELERVNCDEWPFPIKFLVTTTEFSGASIINE